MGASRRAGFAAHRSQTAFWRRWPSRPVAAVAEGWLAGAGFEGRVDLLEAGARILPLIGNQALVVRRVRDPATFFALLDRVQVPHPPVRFAPPGSADAAGWLRKDARGTGGWQVWPWVADAFRHVSGRVGGLGFDLLPARAARRRDVRHLHRERPRGVPARLQRVAVAALRFQAVRLQRRDRPGDDSGVCRSGGPSRPASVRLPMRRCTGWAASISCSTARPCRCWRSIRALRPAWRCTRGFDFGALADAPAERVDPWTGAGACPRVPACRTAAGLAPTQGRRRHKPFRACAACVSFSHASRC